MNAQEMRDWNRERRMKIARTRCAGYRRSELERASGSCKVKHDSRNVEAGQDQANR